MLKQISFFQEIVFCRLETSKSRIGLSFDGDSINYRVFIPIIFFDRNKFIGFFCKYQVIRGFRLDPLML
ncbi:MAG: hypothetical protein IPO04_08145 [Cytophagaceae bacterium]|nr:hypothetical protein [Cytophagaceae bacterium]